MLDIDTLIHYVYVCGQGEKDPPQYHQAEVTQSTLVYLTAYKQAREMLVRLAGPASVEEIERKAKVWQPDPR